MPDKRYYRAYSFSRLLTAPFDGLPQLARPDKIAVALLIRQVAARCYAYRRVAKLGWPARCDRRTTDDAWRAGHNARTTAA